MTFYCNKCQARIKYDQITADSIYMLSMSSQPTTVPANIDVKAAGIKYLLNYLHHPAYFHQLIALGVLDNLDVTNDEEGFISDLIFNINYHLEGNKKFDFLAAILRAKPELIHFIDQDSLKSRIRNIIKKNLLQFSDELTTSIQSIDVTAFRNCVAELLDISLNATNDEFTSALHNYDLDKLLSNKIIVGYLARSTFLLSDEGYPVYDDWEKILYSQLDSVPFRKRHYYSKAFYTSGTYKPDTASYVRSTQASMTQSNNFLCSLHVSEETYSFAREMRAKNTFIQSNDYPYHYVITALGKDNHAFAALSVIDSMNQQTKLVIFINSFEDPAFCNHHKWKFLGEFDASEEESPLIFDASLPMQIYAFDKNCALYTTEIVEALYRVLENNPALRKKLETLTSLVKNQKAEANSFWKNKLENEFKTTLEICLPHLFCMVDDEPIPRGQRTKFAWCINRRWLYGQQYLLKYRQVLLEQARTELESIHALASQLNMENEVAEIDMLLSKKLAELLTQPIVCTNIQAYYHTHILSEQDAALEKELSSQTKIRPVIKNGEQLFTVTTERGSNKSKRLLRPSIEADQAVIQALSENPHILFSAQVKREQDRLSSSQAFTTMSF